MSGTIDNNIFTEEFSNKIVQSYFLAFWELI